MSAMAIAVALWFSDWLERNVRRNGCPDPKPACAISRLASSSRAKRLSPFQVTVEGVP